MLTRETTCFVSPVPCQCNKPSRGSVSRRPRLIKLSGKGFGKPREPPRRNSLDPISPIQSGSDSSKPFVPRGPTLREEYERKGLIEPSLGPDAGTLPEIVANRMLRRILGFGGVPLIMLFGFFGTYFVLRYKYDITVLPAVVAYSTLGTITLAGIGITYGIFSSSWDEDEEGSWLGWEEASTNLLRAKDGLFGARDREKREEKFEKLDILQEKERRNASSGTEDEPFD